MALEKQTVSFPLAKGIDEKSSGKTRAHDSLENCLNAQMEKTGEIRKRNGFRQQGNAVVGGGNVDSGVAIAQYRDETLVFDGTKVYSKDASGNFLDKGFHVPCEYTNTPKRRELDRRQGNVHMVEVRNIRVYVWTEYRFNNANYHVMVMTEDKDTGSSILSPTSLHSVPCVTTGGNALFKIPRPQLASIGDYAFILYNEYVTGSYNNIQYASVNCTDQGTAAATPTSAKLTDAATAAIELDSDRPIFMIDKVNNVTQSDAIVLAYHPSGTTNAWQVRYLTASTSTLTAESGVFNIAESSYPGIFASWAKGSTPVANEIVLKALNDNQLLASSHQIFLAINVNDGSGNPDIMVWLIEADLSGAVKTSPSELNDHHLISGTVGVTSDDNSTIKAVFEVRHKDKAGVTGLQVCEHKIMRFDIARSSATATLGNSVVAYNSSVLSDMFRYNSRLYYVVAHVNAKNLVGEDGRLASANNFLMDHEDNIIGALPTGSVSNCFTSEYVQRDPDSTDTSEADIRRLVYGVQRVHEATDQFTIGASLFAGVVSQEAGGFAYSDYKDNIFGISEIKIDFDPARTLASLDVDRSLLFTGGYLSSYDGEQICENGFAVFPSIKAITTSDGGTSAARGIPDGTYRYAVVYEWADANGVIHRSAPSGQVSVTTPTHTYGAGVTTSKVLVQIYVPNFTRKGDILARVYRTENDGDTLFEVGSMRLDADSEAHDIFIDFPKDSERDITDEPPLYTSSELSDGFFGSCTDLIRHKHRVCAVGANDVVYYSKPLVDGSGAQFPDTFNIPIFAEGDRTSGIESNLDHLVIFTEDNGYMISGDGPDATGAVGGFTAPRLFASGQGMVYGAPHADTPVGVFIMSNRGMYLIGRDMSVKYIGAQIEDSISSLSVVNMLRHDPTNEVRVMVTDKGTSGGTDLYLVYNYYFAQWTRWEITYSGNDHHVAEIYDGTDFYRLTTDGRTQKQQSGTFQDNNTGSDVNYNFGFVTSDISPGGLLQAHRIYRFLVLGDYVSDHTATVKMFYDYNTSSTKTFTKSVTSTNDAPMLLRAHLDQQKCRAVKMEVMLSGSGECAKLDGIALEIGRRPTTFKPGTSRSERTM